MKTKQELEREYKLFLEDSRQMEEVFKRDDQMIKLVYGIPIGLTVLTIVLVIVRIVLDNLK